MFKFWQRFRGSGCLWVSLICILIVINLIFPNCVGIVNDKTDLEVGNSHENVVNIYGTRAAPSNETNITFPEVTYYTAAYAIICPANLSETLKPLVYWKTQKGVPAAIYNTDGKDGIYASFPDGDNASKIHGFLAAMHENNSNLEWVLLVGDEDIIPSRKIFVNAKNPYGLDDYYYSDHYYAGLNNSWDQDNDGIYGEQKGDVNWWADLYVGRLPVNNVSEAEIAVNKILKYETTPETGQWMSNASVWSGLLDAPNNLSAYQSYKDNAIKVSNKLMKHIPEHMTINHLYDYNQLQGGFYSFNDDTLTKINVKKDFNSGTSIINFAGQAYYTGDELAHYFDVAGLEGIPDGFGSLYSYNDGKYSTNGNRLPLMYLSTCSVNFTEPDDSNLEQLITAADGGVIGLISNSGKSYRGETENGSSYGNWWLSEHFWKQFFAGMYQPGKCLYELKKNYNIEVIFPNQSKSDFYIQMAVANLVGYNLLGDPELNIWTDLPGQLNMTSSIILEDTHKLNITVTNDSGVPVENARVCVYNEEVYDYEITDSDGVAILAFDPRLTSTLKATITAHNFLPFSRVFSHENKPPVVKELPELNLDEDTILVDAIIFDDYISDPDNTINQMQITLFNISTDEVEVWVDRFNVLQIRPPPNWNGEITGTMNISDGVSSVERPLKITVHPVNDSPIVNEIAPQSVKAGQVFEYQVNAFDIDNDKLTYSDDSNMFNINPESGFIKFKANDEKKGTHEINVTVTDGKDNASVIFTLEIIGEPKDDFWVYNWFPMAVILGLFIFITLVLIFSKIQERKRKQKEEDEKQDKKPPRQKSSSKKTKKEK